MEGRASIVHGMCMGMCHCGTGRSAERGAQAGRLRQNGNRSRRPAGQRKGSLHSRKFHPSSICISGSARARLTKRERTGLQNPQTAAPRESRGVTRADFVHHSSYRIHSGLITTHVRRIFRDTHTSHSVGCAKVVGVQQPPTRLGNTPNKYNAVQLECSVLQSRPPICLDSPPTLTQPPA